MSQTKHILYFLFAMVSLTAKAQNHTGNDLSKFSFLLGDWVGDGSGEPGKGEGWFSFKPDLDNRVIVRKNHSSYPATTTKPAFSHDDLLVIYADNPGSLSNALYTDNEDHTIHYSIQFPDQKTIVFLSDAKPGMPVFRLSYIQKDNDNVDIKFEIAPPNNPGKFNVYLQGGAHRKK